MTPIFMNFIMAPHSMLPFFLLLLILLLPSAVLGDLETEPFHYDTTTPNCNLPLDVCDSERPMKVLRLGNQTWCKKEEGIDPIGYNEIIIHDSEFQKVLDSRNCSALFNYNLTIPWDSPITSFRLPFPDNIIIYKCNPGYNITDHDQHLFKHHCPDFDIFTVDGQNFLSTLEGCEIFIKLPFLMNPAAQSSKNNTDIFEVITTKASIHAKLCSSKYFVLRL